MKTIWDKYYISNYIYILVEIIHTEFQYISLIEIEKELRKEKYEKKDLLSRLVLPTGTAHPFVPVARLGTKGWETGTTKVSQPGQISVSVVVRTSLSAWFPQQWP